MQLLFVKLIYLKIKSRPPPNCTRLLWLSFLLITDNLFLGETLIFTQISSSVLGSTELSCAIAYLRKPPRSLLRPIQQRVSCPLWDRLPVLLQGFLSVSVLLINLFSFCGQNYHAEPLYILPVFLDIQHFYNYVLWCYVAHIPVLVSSAPIR